MGFRHGKCFSFRKGLLHQRLLCVTYILLGGFCEIRREAIRIICIVIVGVAVVVDATEIVVVVVIRRALPPVNSGAPTRHQNKSRFAETHPKEEIFIVSYRF